MVVKNLKEKSIDIYKETFPEEVELLYEKAKELKGIKVTHVNATAFGGGVAELLKSLVPLMNSLGIENVWEVMEAPAEFFNVTKKIHNALQGMNIDFSNDEWELFFKVNEENAKKLNLDGDVIIIHDPQPAAIPLHRNGKYIWRCHIDTSHANTEVLKKLNEPLKKYERHLYHIKDYFIKGFENISKVFPPSIDPLSEKNKDIPDDLRLNILKKYKVDPSKPIITVVARFDPWKDLFSAIDVYRKVKEKIKDAQLLIVSAMAHDDPEGWIFFEKVLRYAGVDDNIFFLTNLIGVGDLEVNAFQRSSTLGLHTATREGFGLVISEIMWKNKPVVARPVGGITIQVDDKENGYLAWDVNELADRIIELILNDKIRKSMGEKAREKVKNNFLILNHIERYLDVIKEII